MRVALLLMLFLLMLTVWSGVMAWESSAYMARPCPERELPVTGDACRTARLPS
jgi:hypothetical protein